mgnify:CR=1 FL=1
MHNEHFIDGKWIDCKSAIPFEVIKSLEKKEKEMKKHYRSFDDAREFVHSFKLKSKSEWLQYCKSGNKPEDIPVLPAKTYQDQWIGWGNWLGTNRIANQKMKFNEFGKAKKFVKTLLLKVH